MYVWMAKEELAANSVDAKAPSKLSIEDSAQHCAFLQLGSEN